MTEKVRSKTIAERFGFSDPDIKKPLHDEIVLWIDRNCMRYLSAFMNGPLKPELTKPELTKSAEQLKTNLIVKGKQRLSLYQAFAEKTTAKIAELEKDGTSSEYELKNTIALAAKVKAWFQDGIRTIKWLESSSFVPEVQASKTWEYPISTGSTNKYVVGFVDLHVTYYVPHTISLDGFLKNCDCYSYRPCGCLPSIVPNPEDCNRYDLRKHEWNLDNYRYEVCFEAKTEIPSLGELIRQIRLYQEYVKGMFCVVCPDDRFATQLKEQGIYFIKYEP